MSYFLRATLYSIAAIYGFFDRMRKQ